MSPTIALLAYTTIWMMMAKASFKELVASFGEAFSLIRTEGIVPFYSSQQMTILCFGLVEGSFLAVGKRLNNFLFLMMLL